jgi:hypothetical protein
VGERRPALADLVPFITKWSEEHTTKAPVIQRHGGIAYPCERPGDRDRHGVLWVRTTSNPGQGRPLFGQVHARRQRQVMTRQLCQVCARPADRTGGGVLWLVTAHPTGQPDWPDPLLTGGPLVTADPPVCAPCAAQAVAACPALRRGYAALRVRQVRPVAVRGRLYQPAKSAPLKLGAVTIDLDDRRVRWVQAGQLLVELSGYTITTIAPT